MSSDCHCINYITDACKRFFSCVWGWQAWHLHYPDHLKQRNWNNWQTQQDAQVPVVTQKLFNGIFSTNQVHQNILLIWIKFWWKPGRFPLESYFTSSQLCSNHPSRLWKPGDKEVLNSPLANSQAKTTKLPASWVNHQANCLEFTETSLLLKPSAPQKLCSNRQACLQNSKSSWF